MAAVAKMSYLSARTGNDLSCWQNKRANPTNSWCCPSGPALPSTHFVFRCLEKLPLEFDPLTCSSTATVPIAAVAEFTFVWSAATEPLRIFRAEVSLALGTIPNRTVWRPGQNGSKTALTQAFLKAITIEMIRTQVCALSQGCKNYPWPDRIFKQE